MPDLLPPPIATLRRLDVSLIQCVGRGLVRDRASSHPWLRERPLYMGAKARGTLHSGPTVGNIGEPATASLFLFRAARLPELNSSGLRNREALPDAFGNQLAFLLGDASPDMQREIVEIVSELGDDKVHLLLDEPTDEMHIAREAVKPGDNQRTMCQRCLM